MVHNLSPDQPEKPPGHYFRHEADRLVQWMNGRLAVRLDEEKRPDVGCNVEYSLLAQMFF